MDAKSVAFKCTFNDGTRLDGPQSNFVGFRGTCSRDLIAHNVRTHVWCSQPENECKKFADRGMKGKLPEFPCLESRLFEEWRFDAGEWHKGRNKGKLIPIHGTAPGKVVILTTRRRGRQESKREIIGAYEINKIIENCLVAAPSHRIRLTTQQAELLEFWRYYRNSNANESPSWRTGLVRYLEDEQVHNILTDMSVVCGDSPAGDATKALLTRQFGNAPATPPSGALATRVAHERKYPGGEGPDHLRLKLWVARNPAAVGLPPESRHHVEHLFKSGDCVDIAFELPTGNWVVVEIETNYPYPGAYQAVKYRALLAAQRGWELATNRAVAILVAWKFDPGTLDFCRKYNIETWTCRCGQEGSRAEPSPQHSAT